MQHQIKTIIDKEFAANEVPIVARVEPSAWQFDKPTNFRIKLLIEKGGRQVLTAQCYAQRPFELKVINIIPMKPHRLIRLCDILQEAFKELERKSGEGEDQFK